VSEIINSLQPPYIQPKQTQIIIPQNWREWLALVWSGLRPDIQRETVAAIVVFVSVLLFVVINTLWQLQKAGML